MLVFLPYMLLKQIAFDQTKGTQSRTFLTSIYACNLSHQKASSLFPTLRILGVCSVLQKTTHQNPRPKLSDCCSQYKPVGMSSGILLEDKRVSPHWMIFSNILSGSKVTLLVSNLCKLVFALKHNCMQCFFPLGILLILEECLCSRPFLQALTNNSYIK